MLITKSRYIKNYKNSKLIPIYNNYNLKFN